MLDVKHHKRHNYSKSAMAITNTRAGLTSRMMDKTLQGWWPLRKTDCPQQILQFTEPDVYGMEYFCRPDWVGQLPRLSLLLALAPGQPKTAERPWLLWRLAYHGWSQMKTKCLTTLFSPHQMVQSSQKLSFLNRKLILRFHPSKSRKIPHTSLHNQRLKETSYTGFHCQL